MKKRTRVSKFQWPSLERTVETIRPAPHSFTETKHKSWGSKWLHLIPCPLTCSTYFKGVLSQMKKIIYIIYVNYIYNIHTMYMCKLWVIRLVTLKIVFFLNKSNHISFLYWILNSSSSIASSHSSQTVLRCPRVAQGTHRSCMGHFKFWRETW